MVERSDQLDLIYRALGDPTRRSLLTALRSGDARIKDLADPLPMSFAAVARHVATLEKAQLISREVRGREHWISINAAGLTDAQAWIDEQSAAWSARADALSDYLQREAS